MNPQQVISILKHKPSVHKLCYGAFIQETIQLNDNVYAVPLKSLGFSDESEYAAKYVVDICGGNVEQQQLDNLKKQGENALPVIALVVQLKKSDDSPEKMEKYAESELAIPEKVVGWAAGEELTSFAYITCNSEQQYFRILPPHSRRRQRLGFGNTGEDFSNQIQRMIHCAQKDEHFLFALSLYKDALNESNQVFKIARLFSVLESLAYKLKSQACPSRKAVKQLLGLTDGAFVCLKITDKEYKFDRIEISGRLRDKLFHGVPFKEKDLNQSTRHVFELLEKQPETIANSLREDCELEFARWANGASNGLKMS
jgi:hypothetical protein